MSQPIYEHCLGCGQDVTPCQVPDRCRLLGWRHAATGFHWCATGTTVADPGHQEPGWVRVPHGWERA